MSTNIIDVEEVKSVFDNILLLYREGVLTKCGFSDEEALEIASMISKVPKNEIVSKEEDLSDVQLYNMIYELPTDPFNSRYDERELSDMGIPFDR